MPKQNKTISLDTEIIEQLSRVDNASGLIEELLREHFALNIIKELDTEALISKRESLQKELKEIDKEETKIEGKQKEEMDLKAIGIDNKEFIELLRNHKEKPSVHSIKHWKHLYNLDNAMSIYEAWNYLHPEWRPTNE